MHLKMLQKGYGHRQNFSQTEPERTLPKNLFFPFPKNVIPGGSHDSFCLLPVAIFIHPDQKYFLQ